MSRIRRQFRELVNEFDTRASRLRPGSVLILVVVLLVLMALLGTAYLITARNDRTATKLFDHNVQIDMLVRGVESMAIGAMSDTTYQTSTAQRYDDWFTSSSTPLLPNNNPYTGTMPKAVDHSWLASRIPGTINVDIAPNAGSYAGLLASTPAASTPYYPIPAGAVVEPSAGKFYLALHDNVTSPVGGALGTDWADLAAASGSSPTPYIPTTAAGYAAQPFWPALSAPVGPNVTNEDPRYPYVPSGYATSPRPDNVRFATTPTYLTINGQNYPALQYYGLRSGQVEVALAASASGNGIADSFLWRLPIGTIDGITYYAAVRIIDNNSAINVNTANSELADFSGAGTATANAIFSPGIFPAHVGLNEMLYSFPAFTAPANDTTALSPEIVNRNTFLFGQAIGSTYYRPDGITGGTTSPIDDLNTQRGDFRYGSLGDAMYMGLGRRINRPGYSFMPSAGTTPVQYQPFTWADSQALAYKFDLPNVNASLSNVELCLVNSLWNNANGATWTTPGNTDFHALPWDPSQITTTSTGAPGWFTQYIEPAALSGNLPKTNAYLNRRAYVVAHSPVSNLMPVHDLTSPQVTGMQSSGYLSFISPPPATPSGVNYITSKVAPKVSLNTAPAGYYDYNNAFGNGPTLWFGFYNAMVEAINGPNEMIAKTSAANNIITLANTAAAPSGIPQGFAMFRSPIRDPAGAGPVNYTKAGVWMTGPETLLLRSLLASVNAKDLRDSGDNVEWAHNPAVPAVGGANAAAVNYGIPLPASKLPGGTASVVAFGTERQVFITEVYVNNEVNPPPNSPNAKSTPPLQNPKGYVAVELYNPYDFAVDMTWWTLLIASHNAGGAPMTLHGIDNFPGFGGASGTPTLLQPHSYMVLDNMPNGAAGGNAATDAQYVPSGITLGTIQTTHYYVQNLHEVITGGGDSELILLRQCNAHGFNATNPNPAAVTGDMSANAGFLGAFAPVDSFDFGGMQLSTGQPGQTARAYHYVRANPGTNPAGQVSGAGPTATAWRFVYPGRWDLATYGPFYQEGVEQTSWTIPDPSENPPKAGDFDPWGIYGPTGKPSATPTGTSGVATPINLGATKTVGANGWGALNDPSPSYINPFMGIQLNNTDMGGPNKMAVNMPSGISQKPYLFPFGGFSRVGDILQVPFIGAYMIFDSTGKTCYEINPVTRDASLADHNDGGAADSIDPVEQIGRFCPLITTQQVPQTPENAVPVGALATTYDGKSVNAYNPYDPYAWASHIFDYFTVIQNPSDDYIPNVDPLVYPNGSWNMNPSAYAYDGAPSGTARGVSNVISSGNGPNLGAEDTVPNEGQININTASWRTLAAIPWTYKSPPASATAYMANQAAVAKAIVAYRQTYGPFKTLFDLNKVPVTTITGTALDFQNANGPISTQYTATMGNISPYFWQTNTAAQNATFGSQTSDDVTGDFENRYMTMTHASNLLTTRSDSFTVYVLVQGWTGVGTATPQVVVQRRAAIIVDRSQLTPTNPSLNVMQVQAN